MNFHRAAVSILKVIDSGYWTDIAVEVASQCIVSVPAPIASSAIK